MTQMRDEDFMKVSLRDTELNESNEIFSATVKYLGLATVLYLADFWFKKK